MAARPASGASVAKAETTPHGDSKQPGLTVVKAVSEAIFLSTALTITKEENTAQAIKESLHP